MTAADLVGTWKLAVWRTRLGDAVRYPFGERPSGLLIYTPRGEMSVQIAAQRRSLLATEDPIGGAESERASAFSSYLAYTGTYEVVGDAIVHRVATALFPNWVGTEQRRRFTYGGNVLTVGTDPMEVGGEVVVNELVWIREP